MDYPPPPWNVRLAEVVAALALATDLGKGQPIERSLRTCLLAIYFGQLLGLTDEILHDVYYVTLLHWTNCTAYGQEAHTSDTLDMTEMSMGRIAMHIQAEAIHLFWEIMGADDIALSYACGEMDKSVAIQWRPIGSTIAYCDIAQSLPHRLGLRQQLSYSMRQMEERWDGSGTPGHFSGDAIALAVRIVQLALDAELFERLGGIEFAINVLRRRAGIIYDPTLVAYFCDAARELFPRIECKLAWQAVLEVEPGMQAVLTDVELEAVLQVIGDVADLHSSSTVGHSRIVATLAAGAAKHCSLPETDIIALRYAGLVQDIGMIASTPTFGNKPKRLSESERERMRLHPYYTERILTRSRALTPIGILAGLHHERLDGSGYHRGLCAGQLTLAARILATSDVYAALIEPDTHLPDWTLATATEELHKEIRAGKLDGEAVSAVLAAAGHRTRRTRRTRIAGLTNREIEVLRLLSGGFVNHQIAENLGITANTVDHHIRHIYDKIDVSSRAEAARFAMRHQILDPGGE